MFDLQPGVHLQEEEVITFVEQELDGTCTAVTNTLGRRDRGLPHSGAQLVGHRGTRCLLNDFLVAPLN